MRKLTYYLSLLMIFMIPWEGVLNISHVGSITRVIGVCVAACWVGSILGSGRIRHLRPFHILVAGFIFWIFMTLLWSTNNTVSQARVITFVQIGVLFLVIWDVYDTRNKIQVGLQAFILGSWLSVYSTVSNFLLRNAFRANTAEWTRYSGFGFNADDLAFILALALPIAWYLVLVSDDQESALISKLRLMNIAFIPLALFAILLTATRGALVATIPFVFFFIGSLTRLNIGQKIIFSILIIGSIFVIQPLIPQTSIDRLATTQSEITDGDVGNRRGIWEQGLEVFWEHPVGGVGVGTFRYNVPEGKVAHNAYISVLVETGAVGFFLFMLIMGWSFWNALSLPNKKDKAFWVTILLIWAIGVSTLSWEHRKPTWLIVSFILANLALYGRYNRVPAITEKLLRAQPIHPMQYPPN